VKLFGFLFAVLFAIFVVWIVMVQPTIAPKGPEILTAGPAAALKEHVELLSMSLVPRNINSGVQLDSAASYILGTMATAGARVTEQTYKLSGTSVVSTSRAPTQYRNIIGSFGPEQGERIVVGAHYDVFGDFPGADDNASGVAALLELSKRLAGMQLPVRVDLVAWTLEEPPAFATSEMGSAVFAQKLAQDNVPVRAVIVLECIGYFSDAPGSQTYPMPLLKLWYPSQGNFIAVIGNLGSRDLAKSVKQAMQGASDLPVTSLNAPTQVPGVDFSDHRSFWPHGWPAVMVTDTAFYRNSNYHTAKDTADTLDYNRMAKVVAGVAKAIEDLAQ